MGLSMQVTKVEESSDHCVYVFGSDGDRMGRARLDKSTGDVELLSLTDGTGAPSRQYCLAHVVPRLQAYHSEDTYPESDAWDG